jgi:hypothetical protein
MYSGSYGNVRGPTVSGEKREGQVEYKKSGLRLSSEGKKGRIREDEAIRRKGANSRYPASEGRRSERESAVCNRRTAIVPEGGSPKKQGNRTAGTLALKRREKLPQGKEPSGRNTMDTSRFSDTVSTKQRRITEVAGRITHSWSQGSVDK